MAHHDETTHISATDASGGSKEGVVRWVLAGGLILAVVLLSVIWIVPALMHDDVAGEGDVSSKIQAAEARSGDSTDSMVGERVDPAQAETTTGTGGVATVPNETPAN